VSVGFCRMIEEAACHCLQARCGSGLFHTLFATRVSRGGRPIWTRTLLRTLLVTAISAPLAATFIRIWRRVGRQWNGHKAHRVGTIVGTGIATGNWKLSWECLQSTDGRDLGGTPERIRTSDLLLRRQALYPAELRAHIAVCIVAVFTTSSSHHQQQAYPPAASATSEPHYEYSTSRSVERTGHCPRTETPLRNSGSRKLLPASACDASP
jgi:hypothetical protein